MRYIDAFREPRAALAIRRDIGALAAALPDNLRPYAIMEICGSHTMAIARYGIRDGLADAVDLVSGPGCPVCVTAPGYIDTAIELAERGAVIATFGDLLNVPGSETTLAESRSRGARVEVCYSPLAAVELARRIAPDEVVFLAIGFETTIGPVVSIVDAARRRDIANVSLLTAFKLVPPALRALLNDPEVAVRAFLCPAHVSAIIGAMAYEPFAGVGGVPCVIAGFEPLDILLGLKGILEQAVGGASRVENQYSRVVRPEGNLRAQALMETYLQPEDAVWRGIGRIPASGLRLRPEFAGHDAAVRFGVRVKPGRERPGCRCGDVIKGKCKPPDCALFAKTCTPDRAVGPCMVSSEGTCAAYFKYSRITDT